MPPAQLGGSGACRLPPPVAPPSSNYEGLGRTAGQAAGQVSCAPRDFGPLPACLRAAPVIPPLPAARRHKAHPQIHVSLAQSSC